MKVTLVGEHNPYGQDPRYALYPRPTNSAGGRLCKVLGMSALGYINQFHRRNLLDTLKWSAPRARAAALDVQRAAEDGDALVLLGSRVSAAFGVEFVPLYSAWFTGTRVRLLVIPHPSGRSRLWNEAGMAVRVRAAVEALTPPHA